MAKDKKKIKKNKSLYKTLKTSIPKNPVLYSILGVAGLGLAIGSAIDENKRRAMLDKVTNTFKGVGKPTEITNTNVQPDDIAVG